MLGSVQIESIWLFVPDVHQETQGYYLFVDLRVVTVTAELETKLYEEVYDAWLHLQVDVGDVLVQKVKQVRDAHQVVLGVLEMPS